MIKKQQKITLTKKPVEPTPTPRPSLLEPTPTPFEDAPTPTSNYFSDFNLYKLNDKLAELSLNDRILILGVIDATRAISELTEEMLILTANVCLYKTLFQCLPKELISETWTLPQTR